jgi:hypothetical protein
LTTNKVVAQVTSRGAQRQQEEAEEANSFTCLHFSDDRHKQFKGTCSNFCEKCDKLEVLAPHKKTEKEGTPKCVGA